jgi:uncharacterized surface protein with fasciclin (FAS1) repeats
MKKNILNYPDRLFTARFYWILLLFFMIYGCQEEPREWNPASDDIQIAEYISLHPEDFSEFEKIARETGLYSLMRASTGTGLTLFLPNNHAMAEYYAEKGITSFHDLDSVKLRNLVLNHLIPLRIETSNIPLGALNERNMLGDNIVTEFSGSEIILNKYARIIKRNIINSNGVIHVIEKVLDPLTMNVYAWLKNDPAFTIFTRGLELCGLSDTLSLVEFPYGNINVRTRYTLLAVPDTVYNNRGIASVNDLISLYANGDQDLTNLENGFYQYMEYHCLSESYYLSNFLGKNYPVLSRNNYVSMQLKVDDYMLNHDAVNGTYTGFIFDYTNMPAKNGVVHAINDLLPVKEPSPETILFEVTDFFDIKQTDYYGKYYKRFFDGQNTFEKVKWEGDYLLYYYKVSGGACSMNYDCFSMNGFWWIQITVPKIMKGKYTVGVHILTHSAQSDMIAYIDGEKVEGIINARIDPWTLQTVDFAVVDWKETEEHTFRFDAINYGLLFMDYLQFTPAK